MKPLNVDMAEYIEKIKQEDPKKAALYEKNWRKPKKSKRFKMMVKTG